MPPVFRNGPLPGGVVAPPQMTIFLPVNAAVWYRRGEGLSMPLNQFDVSFAPDAPAVLLKNHADPNEVSRWSMQAVPVGPAYIAALVVEGFGWRLSTFHVKLDP